jgi:S1-C subfamily serine protease
MLALHLLNQSMSLSDLGCRVFAIHRGRTKGGVPRMLLKLTCPACGRSDQASDRVIGKEIRCPCGAIFRVVGPKQAPLSGPELLDAEPCPRPAISPQYSATSRQPETRSRPPSSSRSSSPSPTRPRPQGRQPTSPEPPTHQASEQPKRGGLPPWTYAAFGGGAVLFLVVIGALMVSLSSSTAPTSRKPTQADDRVVSQPETQPGHPSDGPLAVAAEPKASDNQPVTVNTETPAPSNTNPTLPGTPLTTAQIVARREPSVALIKGKASSGTGFVIRYGVIATNAHVIEEEFISNLEVRFPSAPAASQGPAKAQLLYEDRKRDIAFLAVKSDLPVLPVAPNYSFVKGEDILVIGNPGMGDDTVLENAISRGVMSAKTVIEGMPYHQMNISINPGNSGGPVFDSLGRVIGVATLKSNKTEAMGFCIPVEDVNAALAKLGRPRPELGSHHRAIVALKVLTLGGALYSIALEVRSGILRAAPSGGSDANLLPTEEVQKLHEAITSLDEKLVSQVASELPGLRSDSTLSQTAQQGYQQLSDNYERMKQLYTNPNRLADQYFTQIQSVKAEHLRLIQSFQRELNIEVAPKLLALLQPRTMTVEPPTMVADFVPPQFQPRFSRIRPGMMGPRIGPGPGMQDPLQAAREQRKQMQDRMRKQMQDMRSRTRGRFGNP